MKGGAESLQLTARRMGREDSERVSPSSYKEQQLARAAPARAALTTARAATGFHRRAGRPRPLQHDLLRLQDSFEPHVTQATLKM